jgi:positive regulator of sigma E activity
MHIDAYLLEYENGKIVVKCPRRHYCVECPYEKR